MNPVEEDLLARRYVQGVKDDQLLTLTALQYWDRDAKLAFMDKHGIDISVIS